MIHARIDEKKGVIVLEVPMVEPHRSNTGKTIVIATNGQDRRTTAKMPNGKLIEVMATCYVKQNGEHRGAAAGE